MKTAEEIKKGAAHCTVKGDCRGCPYIKNIRSCQRELTSDALELIQRLQKKMKQCTKR